MTATQRQHRLWRHASIATAVAVAAVAAVVGSTTTPPASAQERGPVGRPFETVVEEVVEGDLILAGNSNLLSAGGWQTHSPTEADIDGDSSVICAARRSASATLIDLFDDDRLVCADNSSSADLDLPPGARVIAARLYVETTVSADLAPLRVALDDPGGGFEYQILPARPPAAERPLAPTTTPTIAESAVVPPPVKLYEAVGDDDVMRQAVWDLTDHVQAAGPGTYTVADIVYERAGPWLPFASWAIVVAYELDPARADGAVAPEHRFARRLISWHDGFQYLHEGSLDVTARGLEPHPVTAAFGKSLHIVAHGRPGRSDNLLLDGTPLGNNNTPGDGPPPRGVELGTDPACNTVTDVQNDSICVLGSVVTTKSPGASAYRSSGDGTTSSSGSGVDMDVVRIPDGALRAAGTEIVVSVQVTGGDTLTPGMVAVSIDVPEVGS